MLLTSTVESHVSQLVVGYSLFVALPCPAISTLEDEVMGVDHPYYSGETVAGKVIGLEDRFAKLEIRRSIVPIDTACLDWNALRSPGEILSLGDRIEVVVYHDGNLDALHRNERIYPRQAWNGVWASRLPLLENPWPVLEAKYPDGSVVEVEMVDYVNWYIARVKMPEGLLVELRTGDIHLRTRKSNVHLRSLNQGERFKVVFRRLYRPGGWVQRFVGGSVEEAFSEAGYLSQKQSIEKLTGVEMQFIERRARR